MGREPVRDSAPYRDRLAALAGGTIEARLDAWAAEHGEPAGRWRPVSGRLEPGRSPWAVLAYEAAGGATVRVLLGDPEPGDPLGRVEIARCTDDPALPGLAPTLAALDRPEVVRYHPGNRCTVRGRSGGSVRYVKVLARASDDQTDARALWAVGLPFAVAEPHGWAPRTRASWYGAVPGGPIAADLLGPGGAGVAERIGRALGELAAAPLRPVHRCGPADQLARTGRALTRAAAAAPALAERLRAARKALARLHDRLPPRPLVPVHGAPHLHQWLVDGTGRLGLVDFDRYAWGEPEFDVATFLVELETEWPRAVGMAELAAATEAGFRSAGGRLDPDRLALWAAHKRLAKVARTAAALRPDAAARARGHLDRLDLGGLGTGTDAAGTDAAGTVPVGTVPAGTVPAGTVPARRAGAPRGRYGDLSR